MNAETLIVIVLTWYDRLMDLMTGGRWTQMNGDVMPSMKVKE
jgi:hypothetical protein